MELLPLCEYFVFISWQATAKERTDKVKISSIDFQNTLKELNSGKSLRVTAIRIFFGRIIGEYRGSWWLMRKY